MHANFYLPPYHTTSRQKYAKLADQLTGSLRSLEPPYLIFRLDAPSGPLWR